jgi:hypothetical protein
MYALLTRELGGIELSTPCPGTCHPHPISMRLYEPQNLSGRGGERKIFFLFREWNRNSSVIQLLTLVSMLTLL